VRAQEKLTAKVKKEMQYQLDKGKMKEAVTKQLSAGVRKSMASGGVRKSIFQF